MKFAGLFGRQRSATTAHHRLQVLLMHERCGGNPDLIPILREDILAAINKHVAVDPDKVRLKIDRGEMVSLLEIDIEIPSQLKHHPGSLPLSASRALGRRARVIAVDQPEKTQAGPFPGATGVSTKSPARNGAELGNETVQRLHLKP